MANIVIKDLKESVELDNQAMRVIVGGARAGIQKVGLQSHFQERDSSILVNIIGNERLRSIARRGPS